MTEPAAGTVVVVGSANLDLIAYAPRIPTAGETVLAERLIQQPGGKGANQAVAAARTGARTVFAGSVGHDAYGDILSASLASAGVDLTYLHRRSGASTGLALIVVAAGGANSITVVPGANATVGEDVARELAAVFTASTVVVLQLEIPLATVLAVATAARQASATVILNPAPAQALPEDLLRMVDVLVPNEHELELLAEERARPSIIGQEAAVSRLRARGPRAVLVTLGARGFLLAGSDEIWQEPGYHVPAVDTTGAGDAFVGALAARLAAGAPLPAAAAYANAAAALSVQRAGAQPAMPTAAEIDALLSTSRQGNTGRSLRSRAE